MAEWILHIYIYSFNQEKEQLYASEHSLMFLSIINNNYCDFYQLRLFLSVLKGYKNWTTQYLCFCGWLLFYIIFLRFIHIIESIISLSVLFLFSVPCMNIPQLMSSFCFQWTFGMSPLGLLWIKHLLSFLYTSISGCKHWFLLSVQADLVLLCCTDTSFSSTSRRNVPPVRLTS